MWKYNPKIPTLSLFHAKVVAFLNKEHYGNMHLDLQKPVRGLLHIRGILGFQRPHKFWE